MDVQIPLMLFGVLASIGSSLLAFASLAVFKAAERKGVGLAIAVSLALMVVGGICSVFHLGHPANFMAAVGHLGSLSGISLELIFLGVCVLAGLVLLVCVRRGNEGASKVFAVVSIVAALLLGFFLGHGYMVEARAGWNTMAMPLAFLFVGLVGGAFVFELIAKVPGDSDTGKLVNRCAAACAVLAFVASVVYAVQVSALAPDAVLVAALAALLGGVVPLACAVAGMRRRSAASVAVGALSACVAAFAIRIALFVAGVPFIDAFAQAIANRGLFM